MATVKHNIEYIATKFGFGLVNLMSNETADRFGKFIGRLFSRLLPKRKKIAIDNLRYAFKDSITDDQYDEIALRSFENIGQTFIDMARFKNFSHSKIKEIVHCQDISPLQKAIDEKRGGIIATAHFGHWEMAGGWVHAAGFPIDIVVKIQSNPLVNKLIAKLRGYLKFGQIQMKLSTLREIMTSLKNNRFVVLAADQHDPSESLILDFFGKKASVAKGPGLFAKKQNCPIIPAVMRRVSFEKYEVHIGEGIYPSDSLDEKADLIRMTKEYLAFLEKIILKYPDQWMWTHRRWKINRDN